MVSCMVSVQCQVLLSISMLRRRRLTRRLKYSKSPHPDFIFAKSVLSVKNMQYISNQRKKKSASKWACRWKSGPSDVFYELCHVLWSETVRPTGSSKRQTSAPRIFGCVPSKISNGH